MTDDPQRPDPTDPGEATQRHRAPDPDTTAAPLSPAIPSPVRRPARRRHRPPAGSYSPSPEARPDWIRTYEAPAPTTPERWYEPAAGTGPGRAPAVDAEADRRRADRRRCAPVRGPRLGRHRPRARRHRRARPQPPRRRGRRPRARTSAPPSRSPSTSPRRPSRSPPRSARPSSASPSPATRTPATSASSPRPASAPASSTTATAGSSPTSTSSRAATSSTSSSRTAASCRARVYGIDTLTDLAIVKVDATDLPTAAHRRVRRAQGRPAGRRHRQPARHVLELGHQRHRVGDRPDDHDRRLRQAPQQPHPDRRGDQPGQLRRPAPRRRRQRHRHQHRHRLGQQRHRLRHPDRHRPTDHGAGRGRRGARAPVPRHQLREHQPPVRRPSTSLPVKQGAYVGRPIDANGSPTEGVRSGTPAADGRDQGRRHHHQGRRQGPRRASTRSTRPSASSRRATSSRSNVLRDGKTDHR